MRDDRARSILPDEPRYIGAKLRNVEGKVAVVVTQERDVCDADDRSRGSLFCFSELSEALGSLSRIGYASIAAGRQDIRHQPPLGDESSNGASPVHLDIVGVSNDHENGVGELLE